ncbi:hypothetical protein DU002_14285 [Corallincola holothuriorum]|uniref:Uncharacterized protein n=1 Tax=Corallincola holothuriorum TaxID=2282215 RepID=A0A368N665_9GAMM|nr:hypothetical protein [Corallincola holothuriorum]RCU45630.1 hypothetical protein DU002_14285 [Corallincola holothuriorum]
MAWKLSSKTIVWSIAFHAALLMLFNKLTMPVFKSAPLAPTIDVYVFHQQPKPIPTPIAPIPTPTASTPAPNTANDVKPDAKSAPQALPKPLDDEASHVEQIPPAKVMVAVEPPPEELAPVEEHAVQPEKPLQSFAPEAKAVPQSIFDQPAKASDAALVDTYSRRGQLRSQLQALEAPVQYQQSAYTTSIMHPAGTPIRGAALQQVQQEVPVIEVECDDAVTEGAALLAGVMGGTLRCQQRSLKEFLQQREAERGY